MDDALDNTIQRIGQRVQDAQDRVLQVADELRIEMHELVRAPISDAPFIPLPRAISSVEESNQLQHNSLKNWNLWQKHSMTTTQRSKTESPNWKVLSIVVFHDKSDAQRQLLDYKNN